MEALSGGSNNSGTTNPTPAAAPTTTSVLSGVTMKSVVSTGQNKFFVNYQANDINTLVVNGNAIELLQTGLGGSGFSNLMGVASGVNSDNAPRIVSGTSYLSRFGIIKNGDEIIAFSNGELTKVSNIPMSGSATYKGEYAGYDHNTDQSSTGNFTGTADFANKKFVVTAQNDTHGFPGIHIDGDISGNTFTANHGGIQAKGRFYGSSAQEFGCVYNNNEQGSFHY